MLIKLRCQIHIKTVGNISFPSVLRLRVGTSCCSLKAMPIVVPFGAILLKWMQNVLDCLAEISKAFPEVVNWMAIYVVMQLYIFYSAVFLLSLMWELAVIYYIP